MFKVRLFTFIITAAILRETGGVDMEALKVICTIIYLLVCAAIVVIVICQDSKSEGLSGAIAGGSGSSYWSKNKGRSKEGILSKITIILAVVFILLSIVLNFSVMQ